ncbi:hypothetical protein NL676_013084 [Syzygium grande]|nr:hypothetical protein NL676_013084 [Syzygium grande]
MTSTPRTLVFASELSLPLTIFQSEKHESYEEDDYHQKPHCARPPVNHRSRPSDRSIPSQASTSPHPRRLSSRQILQSSRRLSLQQGDALEIFRIFSIIFHRKKRGMLVVI